MNSGLNDAALRTWKPAWTVSIGAYCRSVLAIRNGDKKNRRISLVFFTALRYS
jgi:hypothetical protein